MGQVKNNNQNQLMETELFRQEIFNGVDPEELVSLLDNCSYKNIKRDEKLISAGESNHCLYLIASGRFRVHLPGDLASPVVILEPGQSIGVISIIDRQPASANVVADLDSRVLVIEENLLWEMIENSHAIAYNLLVVLAQRLRYGNSVINKIKGLLSEYEYNATVDPLTSLYNRRWLDNTLERVMQRCATNHQPLSVLMIDIDYFKQFNDRHGHIAGDHALCIISETILKNLRPEDLVTRYGGEELFAILPGLDLDEAETIAKRLRIAINEAKIFLSDQQELPSLTASVGVSQMVEQDSPEKLVHAADEAMYRAKHSGRNAVSR